MKRRTPYERRERRRNFERRFVDATMITLIALAIVDIIWRVFSPW